MTERKVKQERERAQWVLSKLHMMYPDVDCTLDFKEDPFRLMVGAILAAQCTDARVNQITPVLFERYPAIEDMAAAQVEDIEAIIRSCGLFRMKAKNIKATAEQLIEKHNGEVPSDEKALLQLPGIGRKIANLILGDSFGIQAVVVDTHCARISNLLGFTDSKNPVRIEKDLVLVLRIQF